MLSELKQEVNDFLRDSHSWFRHFEEGVKSAALFNSLGRPSKWDEKEQKRIQEILNSYLDWLGKERGWDRPKEGKFASVRSEMEQLFGIMEKANEVFSIITQPHERLKGVDIGEARRLWYEKVLEQVYWALHFRSKHANDTPQRIQIAEETINNLLEKLQEAGLRRLENNPRETARNVGRRSRRRSGRR